jgi:hypothetical protein
MSSFFTRTSINRKFLQMQGETDGSLSMRQVTINGNTTITFSSSDDLTVTATGTLNATIIGGAKNDRFDFRQAEGNYIFRLGEGNDRVFDGTGDNTFNGQGGSDTFHFAAADARVETDTINQYVLAEDDIEIAGAVTRIENTGSAGDQVTITLDGGDRIIVNGTGVNAGNIATEITNPSPSGIGFPFTS